MARQRELTTSFDGDLIDAETRVEMRDGVPFVILDIAMLERRPQDLAMPVVIIAQAEVVLGPADLGNFCGLMEDAREAAMRALAARK